MSYTVCLFCGASDRVAEVHKASARDFGAGVAGRGWRLVYGGGRIGLMGLAADAALAAGGEVVGVIPEFLAKHEIEHMGVTELVVTPSMHARKALFAQLSDAFVVLGGGFGTLDETFEMLTWRQLGLHAKPIVVVDVDGAWKPLEALVDSLIRTGFARESHRELVRFVPTVDAAFEYLRDARPLTGSVQSKLG